MSEGGELYESPRGQVELTRDGAARVLTWRVPGDGDEVEMVRLDPNLGVLRIFPRVPTLFGFQDQFDQVREIRLDVADVSWNDVDLVGLSFRTGDLEFVGLPKGFGTIFAYGLGLPRRYRGLVRQVEELTSCTVVHFGSATTEGVDGETFRVSLSRFERYRHAVDLTKQRASTVVSRIVDVEARNIMGELLGLDNVQPTLGRHPIIQAMTRVLTGESSLDAPERELLVAQMSAESRTVALEDPRAFGKLREDIELVSLDVLIEQFGANLDGKAKDEPAWQDFFEKNTFALQQLFAAPIALYGSQLHLRLPNMHGQGGRIADFVLVNTVTRNIFIVEIKAPAAVLTGNAYRGKGGAEVFPPGHDLSGAVTQVQAQMESARLDLPTLIARTPGVEMVETFEVRGAVIAGIVASLNDERRASFLRYRNGLTGVEVITFDEVSDRLIGLRDYLTVTKNDG